MIRFSVHYFLLFTMMATVGPYFPLLIKARGFSTEQNGYLQGLMALGGICGPVVAGYLADRLGRRRGLLMLTQAVFALLLIPSVVVMDFWWACLLMLGIGLFFRPAIPLTDTLASHELPDPTHQYGKVRVWGSIGFVAALAALRMGNLVDEHSAHSMMLCMVIAAVACMTSAMFLPDHHKKVSKTPATEPHLKASPGRRGLGYLFWLFLAAAGTHQLGMTAHYGWLTIYLQQDFHMDKAAWVWAIGSAVEIPFVFYGGRIIGRMGLQAMLIASLGAVSLRLGIYGLAAVSLRLGICDLATALWVILAAQLLHTITFGLFHIASIEFIRRAVPSAGRGLAMALYISLAVGIPTWIGSTFSGVVITHWGFPTLYLIYAAVPLLGIVLLLIGGRRMNLDSLEKKA